MNINILEINQFHSGTAVADAVTDEMLEIKKILISEGYVSNIYAQYIPIELKDQIKSILNYKGNKNSILIVHHSMGYDLFDKIISLPDKKMLIYHNITPEKFFNDEITKKYIRLGLSQVEQYKYHVGYAIADSNYNRKELINKGYRDVDVLPVQISVSRLNGLKINKSIVAKYKNTTNLLFVGRISKNKCQIDLVKVFNIYNKYFNSNSKLILVGDLGNSDYVREVKELTQKYGLHNQVDLLGKVSNSDLKTYYSIANVFLCLSEHEGFGVPLLEAMNENVPVIAYDSSAISETMAGAGIIVTVKDIKIIAALIDELIRDKDLYKKIIERQRIRIQALAITDTKKLLTTSIQKFIEGVRKPSIQMQGPFETSYSLAIVNRKLIQTLDEQGEMDASIYCTEGPGDYEPNEIDLMDKPQAKKLWKKSKNVLYPDITIRNMYPPRVVDVNGGINFQMFGWEETKIPKEYVHDFNRYLDGIGTTSSFVTEVLKECGVTIPIRTIGNGVELVKDFDKLLPYEINSKKKIKFLHISSAFPRKGVDILLNAYYSAFTCNDDVVLIIKTFPNPHNNVEQQIEELNKRYKDYPEVCLINRDLCEKDINRLYKTADCYVHSARGEGFGLPVAEAMLAKVPVIVSPNSGLKDFCTDQTALLVDYDMEEAVTHLSKNGSLWAKPNVESLTELLKKFVYDRETLDITHKLNNAYKLIKEDYSWNKVGLKWSEFIHDVLSYRPKLKVAMVSTWNTKCGIAENTHMQCDAMKNMVEFLIYPNYGNKLIRKDEYIVKERLWHSAFKGDLTRLTKALLIDESNIVHIQFNYGFFKMKDLSDMIKQLNKRKKIIISFHKTEDTYVLGKKTTLKSIINELNLCCKLIVHQERDYFYLISCGVKKELIQIIPLGQIVYSDNGKNYLRKQIGLHNSLILGSYGFFLPHKGIYENIMAVKKLKDEGISDVLYLIVCAEHESNESKEYIQKCKNEVDKLNLNNNVIFITEYLTPLESVTILQMCDVLLMTYDITGESSSGAVRFCLAANRPVITTKQKIFAEFVDITIQIKDNTPELVYNSIKKLINKESQSKYITKISKYLANTNWDIIAEQYLNLYRSV